MTNPFISPFISDPRPWLLWCDVECTGLRRDAYVFEWAFELWNPDGEIVLKREGLVSPASCVWEPGALKLHFESGLLAAAIKAPPVSNVDWLRIDLCALRDCLPNVSAHNQGLPFEEWIPAPLMTLAGSSVHADRTWLEATLGELRSYQIHHRILDVSTLENAELSAGRPSLKALGEEPPHRARQDLDRSITMYRRWLERSRQAPLPPGSAVAYPSGAIMAGKGGA